MIDENKLIKEIRNMVLPLTIPEIDDGTTLAYNEALVDVLNAIEEQPKVGTWIPVEERLPEHCQVVLTSKNGCISIEQFDRKSMCWVERQRNWWWSLNMVDVWMPLPEPYAKGAKKNERL